MERMLSSRVAFVLWLSFLIILTGSAPVQALMTYELTATVNAQYSGFTFSDFSLRYDDADIDGKFSIGELVADSFSGVRIDTSTYGAIYKTVSNVVPYNASTSQYTDGTLDPWGASMWNFSDHVLVWGNASGPWAIVRFNANDWTYAQAVVPLPPSVFLLGSGLLGLAGWRRFRKG